MEGTPFGAGGMPVRSKLPSLWLSRVINLEGHLNGRNSFRSWWDAGQVEASKLVVITSHQSRRSPQWKELLSELVGCRSGRSFQACGYHESSISKVTSMEGTPFGAGGMPVRSKLPSLWLSRV